MSRQLNAIMALASLILLLGLISPPSSSTRSSIFVQAGVIPGRILNSNHEEIFAQQQKELQRTKAKERKPFLACPAGLIPCLSQADAEPQDDVYECVDVTSSLQSCGGCSMRRNEDGEVEVNTGEGQDCTSISNVKGVECYSSRCVITSCKPGFRQTGLGCASIN